MTEPKDALGMRGRIAAIAETVSATCVAAWVGGNAALGAYAARIAFRDLPRETAAATMTTIFGSFDSLAAACVIALAAATVARVWALGILGRHGATRRSDLVATLAAVGLVAVGLAALLWVHPQIEAMFRAGTTATSRFQSLHRVSERLGHAEVVLAIALFGGFAWRRARS